MLRYAYQARSHPCEHLLANSTPVEIRGPVVIQNDGAFSLGTEMPNGPQFASIEGPVTGANASSVQIHNTLVSGQ